MRALDKLGMEKKWIYEVIISSIGGNGPHVAPFGVKTRDLNYIEMEMYKGSDTLKNILDSREFAVNMVVDPVVFYNALFAKEKIKYSSAEKINTPVLHGAPAIIEAGIIDTVDTKQNVWVKAEVVHIHLHNKRQWLNRAKNILFESLILSTRVAHLPDGKAEALLKENYRVVKKVAPGSEYALLMQKLLKTCFGQAHI